MTANWAFLPLGYLLTVLVEAPVLLLALSPAHPPRRRLLAALWLTACTYPVVVLTLPALADPLAQRPAYLLLAETFAPAAECLLFAALVRGAAWRDFAAITAANLASFALGEALFRAGAFG